MNETLPDWELKLFQNITWGINFLIIASSIIFAIQFIRLKERTTGLYMVLVLTLSDLSFPLMNFITKYVVGTGKANEDALYITAVAMYRFSLYCATAIAIFSYLIIVTFKDFNTTKFFFYALLACGLLSLVCPCFIIFNILGVNIKTLGPGMSTVGFPHTTTLKQYTGWFLFDIIGTNSPSIVIFYCYYKIHRTLRSFYASVIGEKQLNSFHYMIYVTIPIICFTPLTFADIINISTGEEYSIEIVFIASLFRRSWGFFNLLAYWFLSPSFLGKNSASNASSLIGTMNDFDVEEETKKPLDL